MSDSTTWFNRLKRTINTLKGNASEKLANSDSIIPSEMVYDSKQLLASLKTSSADKIKDFVDEFNKALPVAEEAGYRLRTVEIRIGIPPKLIPHFDQVSALSIEERAELMERIKDKRYTKMLLSTLFKSSDIQQSIQIGHLPAGVIQIELTAVPNIILVYGQY